jgi:hypothetical protein
MLEKSNIVSYEAFATSSLQPAEHFNLIVLLQKNGGRWPFLSIARVDSSPENIYLLLKERRCNENFDWKALTNK